MKKEEARKAYDALMKFYPFTLDDLDGEQWRDIRGYEGLYQVSNFGRVKSFWHGEHILKPALNPRNYLCAMLYKDGKSYNRRIHRLVAEAFVDNPDNKPQVNHIDGNKQNNCADNLEWVTNFENRQHAIDNGLYLSGESCYNSKLTNEDVIYIRENPHCLPQTQLATLFKVHEKTIRKIQLGRRWKNVGGQIYKPKDRRVPNDVRQQIRAEYVFGSSKFGARALAKKYGVSHQTILHIVHEGDD